MLCTKKNILDIGVHLIQLQIFFVCLKKRNLRSWGVCVCEVQVTEHPPLAVGTLHTEPGTLRAGHYLHKPAKQGSQSLMTPLGAMWLALSVGCLQSMFTVIQMRW